MADANRIRKVVLRALRSICATVGLVVLVVGIAGSLGLTSKRLMYEDQAACLHVQKGGA